MTAHKKPKFSLREFLLVLAAAGLLAYLSSFLYWQPTPDLKTWQHAKALTNKLGHSAMREAEDNDDWTSRLVYEQLEFVDSSDLQRQEWLVDGWGSPFLIFRVKDTLVVRSAGADQAFFTEDDLVFTSPLDSTKAPSAPRGHNHDGPSNAKGEHPPQDQ